MIDLNDNRELNEIAIEYFVNYNKWLTKKKLKQIVEKHSSIKEYRSLKRMFIFYKLHLEKIVLTINYNIIQSHFQSEFKKYIDLFQLYISDEDEYKDKLKSNCYNIFITEMENLYTKYLVSDYTVNKITKNRGYDLLSQLKIRACPYCNRNYTVFINKNNKKIRPEFDHFLPKSQYPLFALSFYNLIPACHICNHVKGVKLIGLNPYERGLKEGSAFKVFENNIPISLNSLNNILEDDYEIKLVTRCEKEQMNIETLALNELYNEHKDYILEILDKTQAYNSHARQSLINSFQGVGGTPKQVYDFVWGRYLDDAEHENRPLSKLTKDILNQLEIK